MSVDRIQTINVHEAPANIQSEEKSVAIKEGEHSKTKEKEKLQHNESAGTSSRITEPIFSIDQQNIQSTVGIEKEPNQRIKQSIPRNVSYWNLLKIMIILCYSAAFLSLQLLIPRKNTIYYPDYWYEISILSGSYSTAMIRLMLELFVFTKEKSLKKISALMRLWVYWLLIALTFNYFAYYIWMSIMEYQPPIPFGGLLVNLCGWIIHNCCIYCMIVFPSELRNNQEFRNKISPYLIYDFWWFFMNLQRDVLSFAFKAISGELQFIFALLIPAIKEINKRVLLKLVLNIVGKEDMMANIFLSIRLNIHYALFVAIRMNGAEVRTVVSVIFVDFFLHLWMTRQIIQMYQEPIADLYQTDTTQKKRQKQIMKLLLAELVEGMVPLAYAIGFAMAFYGPNGNLIGNVLSNIWAYKKVEDVGRLFKTQMILFGVDFVSVLLNTFLLYKFVKINLIREFCNAIEKYWIFFAIQLGNTITIYFGFNDISLGTDMTMNFSWITTEGRLRFIWNSTDLNDEEKAVLVFNKTFT